MAEYSFINREHYYDNHNFKTQLKPNMGLYAVNKKQCYYRE